MTSSQTVVTLVNKHTVLSLAREQACQMGSYGTGAGNDYLHNA